MDSGIIVVIVLVVASVGAVVWLSIQSRKQTEEAGEEQEPVKRPHEKRKAS